MTGRLDIIGVGPGDPELVTLKAARLIAEADAVAYPVTEAGRSRAREIAAAHIRKGPREIGFTVPMRAAREPAQAAYDSAAREIAAEVDGGRRVALLCEGDPFFYGSAMYLHARLAARYPVTVVPGVTSLTATAAALGLPLAGRNDVLKVLPAPVGAEVLARELATADAAAIIKVGRHFDAVREVIAALGLAECAAVVEDATGPGQRVTPLAAYRRVERPYFSTILVMRGGDPWL